MSWLKSLSNTRSSLLREKQLRHCIHKLLYFLQNKHPPLQNRYWKCVYASSVQDFIVYFLFMNNLTNYFVKLKASRYRFIARPKDPHINIGLNKSLIFSTRLKRYSSREAWRLTMSVVGRESQLIAKSINFHPWCMSVSRSCGLFSWVKFAVCTCRGQSFQEPIGSCSRML